MIFGKKFFETPPIYDEVRGGIRSFFLGCVGIRKIYCFLYSQILKTSVNFLQVIDLYIEMILLVSFAIPFAIQIPHLAETV